MMVKAFPTMFPSTFTDWPMVGASPDGINDNMVAEVKCPVSSKSMLSYIAEDGEIGLKYAAQMQLQMLLTRRNEALFCVADPKFESNKKVFIKRVNFDEQLAKDLLYRAIEFWKSSIFPQLLKSYVKE